MEITIEFPLLKQDTVIEEISQQKSVLDVKKQIFKNLDIDFNNIRLYNGAQLLDDNKKLGQIVKNVSQTELELNGFTGYKTWYEIFPEENEFTDLLQIQFPYPDQEIQFKTLQKINAYNSQDNFNDMMLTSFKNKEQSVTTQKSFGISVTDINKVGKSTIVMIAALDLMFKYLDESGEDSQDINEDENQFVCFVISHDPENLRQIYKKILPEKFHKLVENYISISNIEQIQDQYKKDDLFFNQARLLAIDDIEKLAIHNPNLQQFLGDFYSSFLRNKLQLTFLYTSQYVSSQLKFELSRIFQKINVNKNEFGFRSIIPCSTYYQEVFSQKDLDMFILENIKQIIFTIKQPFMMKIVQLSVKQESSKIIKNLQLKIQTEVIPLFRTNDISIQQGNNGQEIILKSMQVQRNSDNFDPSISQKIDQSQAITDNSLKSLLKWQSIQMNLLDICDLQKIENQPHRYQLFNYIFSKEAPSCYSCLYVNVFFSLQEMVQQQQSQKQQNKKQEQQQQSVDLDFGELDQILNKQDSQKTTFPNFLENQSLICSQQQEQSLLQECIQIFKDEFFWIKEKNMFELVIGKIFDQNQVLDELQWITEKNFPLYQTVGFSNFSNNSLESANLQNTFDKIDESVALNKNATMTISKENSIQIVKNHTAVNTNQSKLEQRINSIKDISEKDKQNLIQKWKDNQSNAEQKDRINQYFNILFGIPWDTQIELEDLNMVEAKTILNEKHFGMQKTKEVIMEFLGQFKQSKYSGPQTDADDSFNAIKKLDTDIDSQHSYPMDKIQQVQGKKGPLKNVICLVGPPGVGKTSIVKVISKCLKRDYLHISMGGVTDASFILGHSSVYQGSKPGEIVFQLLKSKSLNPVFLLDEIDKVQSGSVSDTKSSQVLSSLLELLDPSQNSTFKDHYLDISIDLSHAFFICTANYRENIPAPLLDRMEVIECEPYKKCEKVQIANQYVIPKILRMNNINSKQIYFDPEAINYMIQNYQPSESGIRKLEEMIESLARKTSLEIVQCREKNIKFDKKIIDIKTIQQVFGEPLKQYNVQHLIRKPGSALALLAHKKTGGHVSLVESIVYEGSGELICKEEVKEIANMAIAWIKFNKQKIIEQDQFDNSNLQEMLQDLFKKKIDIIINFTPYPQPLEQNGVSGSIALFVSLVSAILKKQVQSNICFIGEITLQGIVIGVSQTKQMVIEAIDRGIDIIVLSIQNENDVIRYLTNEQRARIKFVYIEYIEDLFNKQEIIFKETKQNIMSRSYSHTVHTLTVPQN